MLKFHANCVAVEHMEDYWLVGFADEKFDTKQHLTLERAYDKDEQDIKLGMNTYHVERNDQGYSGYGIIEQFELHSDRVKIKFNEAGEQKMETAEMEITFLPDGRRFGKLKRRLTSIFAGSNCLIIQEVRTKS